MMKFVWLSATVITVAVTSVAAEEKIVQLPDGTWVQQTVKIPPKKQPRPSSPVRKKETKRWLIGSQDDCIMEMTRIHNTMILFKDNSITIGGGSMRMRYPGGGDIISCENGTLIWNHW